MGWNCIFGHIKAYKVDPLRRTAVEVRLHANILFYISHAQPEAKENGKTKTEGLGWWGKFSSGEMTCTPHMSMYLELQLSHRAFTLQTQALSNSEISLISLSAEVLILE